jgi:hypothetical protein
MPLFNDVIGGEAARYAGFLSLNAISSGRPQDKNTMLEGYTMQAAYLLKGPRCHAAKR